tara:strand:- start:1841 stop:1999 length:159 start_codon:yes stop_codon:yes gene_type:complete
MLPQSLLSTNFAMLYVFFEPHQYLLTNLRGYNTCVKEWFGRDAITYRFIRLG